MILQDIVDFLGAERYSQHAICLTNDPLMIGFYTAGDVLIWVSYTVISAVLIICRRQGIQPEPVAFDLFAGFILLCGISHLTKTITIYTGVYRLDVMVIVATAVISSFTAGYTVLGAYRARKYLR